MSTLCQDHRDGRDDNELEYWGKAFRVVRYGYDPTMHFRAYMAYSPTKRQALLHASETLLRLWRREHQREQTPFGAPSCIDYLPADPTAHVSTTTCVTVTTFFHSYSQN